MPSGLMTNHFTQVYKDVMSLCSQEHGIFFNVIAGGQLGQFSFADLLVSLTSSLALLVIYCCYQLFADCGAGCGIDGSQSASYVCVATASALLQRDVRMHARFLRR